MTTNRPTIKSLTAEVEALKKASANLKRSNTMLQKNADRYQQERDVAERTALEVEANKNAEIEAIKAESMEALEIRINRINELNHQIQELKSDQDDKMTQLSDEFNTSQEQEFARQRDEANSALNAELEAAHGLNAELRAKLSEREQRGPQLASADKHREERNRRWWERCMWFCIALFLALGAITVLRSCSESTDDVAVQEIVEPSVSGPETADQSMTGVEVAERLARGEEIAIISSFGTDNISETPQRVDLTDVKAAVVSMAWSNVRAMPSGSAEIKATFDPGTQVTIIGQSGDWYQIEWPGDGKAFMHRSVLKL